MTTNYNECLVKSESSPQFPNAIKTAHSLVGAMAFDSDDSTNSSNHSISPLPHKQSSNDDKISPTISPTISTTTWNTITITLCITYIMLSTQMPFYNKIALEIYTYPITSCFFQVIGVVFILMIISSITYYNKTNLSPFQYIKNLFCDELFILKCKYLLFPALFFSFNIILTNIGIKLTSIDLHILLRGTEIIWFVLLTPILTNDKPTKQAILAAFIVTIGAISLAFSSIDADNISLPALIINISSAFFTPLQIIFLRRATNKLLQLKIFINDNNNNNNNNMVKLSRDEIIEITYLKMLLSLIFIFPASLITEKPKAFNDLMANYGASCNVIVLIIGIIVTLLMQWNVVALTSKVEPILIGTLQQSKGIWTYMVSLIIGGITLRVCGCQKSLECGKNYPSCPCFSNPDDEFHGDYVIPHIIGVVAIISGMVYYTLLKYKNKTIQHHNRSVI